MVRSKLESTFLISFFVQYLWWRSALTPEAVVTAHEARSRQDYLFCFIMLYSQDILLYK